MKSFKTNTFTLFLLAALSPLLFWLAWPPQYLFVLAFVAFIPLLFIEEHFYNTQQSVAKYFGFIYLSLLLWNIATTWWIWNAAQWGSLPAFLLNSLLMCVPWLLYHKTRNQLGQTPALIMLIAAWLAWEYFHLRWQLTWPWLTLGNVFAMYPPIIQWYEYTGHLGGSLWVLAVNVLLFIAIKKSIATQWKLAFFFRAAATVLVPIIFSLFIYFTYQEQGEKVNVTVVQPNVDPYAEKFDYSFYTTIWNKLKNLSTTKSQANTKFIVWPETSLPGNIWLNRLNESKALKIIDTLMQSMPQATLITGVDAYELFDSKKTVTARKFRSGECCFDAYNAAFQIDTSGVKEVYIKSKLVPGVERMPYPQIFGFLENFAIDLGGTSGSLATQANREVFTVNNLKVAPVICYESVFGEYVTDYINQGAQAIFIVTNDAWWGNTDGHKQHLYYASMRAIENRKSIARSANTGISCFINQRGDIQQATTYGTTTAINQDVFFNSKKTIYTYLGDFIGVLAILFTLFYLVFPFMHKRKRL